MCRLVLSQWLPRERPRAWQLVSCIGGGGNAAGTTAALLFLVALAYMPWQAEATAGPLADAVARAKAAAGLAKPPPQEPPGHPPQQFQAVPQLPPRAAQEVVGADVRNDRPAVVSLAVRLPIVGNRDVQLRAAILRQLDQLTSQPGQRGVLVLQFETANVEAAAASDFGRSLALARFLTDPQLAGVKTVAFLPAGASGHAVLVALACDEIVMSPDAVLGPANADEPRIDEAMRVAYREVASRRRTVQPPLAVALLDPSASVLRVVTEVGEQIIPADRLPALRRELQVLKVEELGPIPLTLTGRQGRELGVVRLLARNAADLAKALAIDPARLLVDPSLERGWQAAAVSLSGPVAGMAVARLQSQLDEALATGANFLCIGIDSPGGAPEQSLVLARWLAERNPGQVRTVAYVPQQARGDAALIALACDELVMQKEAILGGEGAAVIGERQAEAIAVAWREIATSRSMESPSLPLALVLPDYVVERMTQRTTGEVAYFSADEFQQRGDRDDWRRDTTLPPGPLSLDGMKAEEYGLAEETTASFQALRARYGLGDDVELIEPSWADRLLDALASPGLAWLLLLIGGAGLYIELQTPGLGLGGFIAMVAFLVYFWSQYLHGTGGWLEVMLFLAGLVCLAAEIFVVPGIGILGLGGGLLMIAALVLASQSFVLPGNAYQVRQVQWSLLGIVGAGIGVGIFASLVRRWLPSTPVLRRVLLVPPEAAVQSDESLEALIGLAGVTTTRLAPAGQAELAGELRDVWSEGMLVESGTTVRVTAVRAGRVLVLPVSGE